MSRDYLKGRRCMVWSFMQNARMYEALRDYGDRLDTVGIFTFEVDATGTLSETGTSISSMMTYINKWPHIHWMLTVMNHGTASIFTALRNNTNGAKDKFLTELVRIMEKYPWCAGVDIDLERGGGFENLILVEGYMDVIALASAGFMNAVAGMGTALTPQQAREIRKLTDKVLVCYDGDKAGRSAAVRNVQPLAAEGIEVRVVSLPDGMDPDDAVKALGADGVKKLLDAALPLVEYKLKLAEDAYGLATANGRAKYVTAALRVLSEVENAAEREVYMGVVSAKSGVSVETLAAESAGKSRTAVPAKREREPREGEGREVRAARFVLNSLLQNRPYANASAVSEDWFASEEHRRILRFVKSQPAGKVVAGNLFGEDAPSEEVGNILAEDPALKSAEKEAGYYADCVTVLANAYLSEQIKKLTEEYKDLADRDEKAAALTRLKTLQKKLKSKNATDKF